MIYIEEQFSLFTWGTVHKPLSGSIWHDSWWVSWSLAVMTQSLHSTLCENRPLNISDDMTHRTALYCNSCNICYCWNSDFSDIMYMIYEHTNCFRTCTYPIRNTNTFLTDSYLYFSYLFTRFINEQYVNGIALKEIMLWERLVLLNIHKTFTNSYNKPEEYLYLYINLTGHI